MKLATYQAPYLPFGSLDAVGLIKDQLATCQAEAVEVLCCPEAVIGGLPMSRMDNLQLKSPSASKMASWLRSLDPS